MGLTVHMDFSAVQAIERISSQFVTRLMRETSRQTLFFIGHIKRTQMTGRHGDIHLNVQTGNLRRSWFPETVFRDGAIVTRAFTRVKYARVHQEGFVSPSGRRIPKRLFITEEFERQMPNRYRNACIKVIKEIARV